MDYVFNQQDIVIANYGLNSWFNCLGLQDVIFKLSIF